MLTSVLWIVVAGARAGPSPPPPSPLQLVVERKLQLAEPFQSGEPRAG